MKILELLNEGTIKVPQSTLNEIMAIACSDFFSRAITYLEGADLEDAEELHTIISRIAKDYMKKFGPFKVYTNFDDNQVMSGSVYVRMGEVDPRYFKQNANAKGRTYTLSVMVSTHPDKDVYNASGSYENKRLGRNAKMEIVQCHIDELKAMARSPELIDGYMDRLEGLVNHEMQHGMQNMALNQSPDAVKYYDKDMNIIDDKYYTDESEFSPQITSAAQDFIGFIKDLKAMNHKFTPETVKQLMTAYINPSAKDMAGIQGLRSKFFETLYRKDKAKWKKAVKYFHGLIQNKV